MKIRRNDDGIVYGDLDVGGTAPATARSEIAPVLMFCGSCSEVRWHVVAVQPYGLTWKLPFARKPLLSSSKAHFLVCNTCLEFSEEEDAQMDKLEAGIVPQLAWVKLDMLRNGRLCGDCHEFYLLPTEACQHCGGPIQDEDDDNVPEAHPKPYTKAWKELEVKEGLSTPAGGDCTKWLDAYRREDPEIEKRRSFE